MYNKKLMEIIELTEEYITEEQIKRYEINESKHDINKLYNHVKLVCNTMTTIRKKYFNLTTDQINIYNNSNLLKFILLKINSNKNQKYIDKIIEHWDKILCVYLFKFKDEIIKIEEERSEELKQNQILIIQSKKEKQKEDKKAYSKKEIQCSNCLSMINQSNYAAHKRTFKCTNYNSIKEIKEVKEVITINHNKLIECKICKKQTTKHNIANHMRSKKCLSCII